MGKVFNDQIIKILCDKNSTKMMGEPNLRSENTPLRRGESYVVFLNQMQRNHLNRLTDSQEEPAAPLHVALCEVRPCHSCSMGNCQALSVSRNHERQQRKYWALTKSLSRRFSENIQSMGRTFMENICLCNFFKGCRFVHPEIEEYRVMPPIFGPFLDECICAVVDRCFYFICQIMGSILEPLNDADSED